jgi:hypothetical protein
MKTNSSLWDLLFHLIYGKGWLMANLRTLLVGSDNPSPGEEAFAPTRVLSSGRRLEKWGAPALSLFDRANAEDDPDVGGRRDVVLFGRIAQRWAGLGFRRAFGEVVLRHGVRFHCFPHPSGRRREYNDPAKRMKLISCLRELA